MILEVLIFLTSIFGLLMSIGHFFQAHTMFKNKSGKNVSLIMYFIFSVGCIVWLAYGITISNTPIILSYVPGAIGSTLVLALKLYYK
jgi:uncharacterized protein with PQ loop repeat